MMHLLPLLLHHRNTAECRLRKAMATTPKQIADLEASHVPAVAKRRADIADEVDPTKYHRINRHCNAFACSMSANVASAPHDDSGFCESVMFINRHGKPPAGKRNEWDFALAVHILRLLATKGRVAMVYLRGTGLWHGTLPTSYEHTNLGSALVSKTLTIDNIRRHACGS